MADQKVIDKLSVIVADAAVFYYKLHNYHWFVTGPHFFGLHEKFEELYEQWTGLMDDVAERMLTIGAKPPGSLAECLKLTNIKEETGSPASMEMLGLVIADLKAQLVLFKETITIAEDADDRGTANLLDGFCDEIEKTLWMLQAVSA